MIVYFFPIPMKVLIIQRHEQYRFIDEFAKVFETLGHTPFILKAQELQNINNVIRKFNPDIFFTVQCIPFLFGLNKPVIHYELDKIGNWDLFKKYKPGPNDLFFVAYKDDIEPLQQAGARFVKYLPFCANTAYALAPNPSPVLDVTFVGSPLSKSGNQYKQLIVELEKAAQVDAGNKSCYLNTISTAEEILKEQEQAFEKNNFILPEKIKKHFIGEIKIFFDEANISFENLTFILAQEAAHRQRLQILKNISSLHIFGTKDWENLLPHATYGGEIKQFDEVGPLFNNSKININIQRIYALSGLSDRVFNIMYSGGFLLSDRNATICELFEEEKDFVAFSSNEELIDKIYFYLKRPDDRLRVAQNGHNNVINSHKPLNRIKEIMFYF